MILALIIPLVASAAGHPAPAGRYIVVLQKAGATTPVGDEVKAVGGTVEAVLRDRLVVRCPASAIETLRAVNGVRSIQPFVAQSSQPEHRVVEQQIPLSDPIVNDTGMTWRSGYYTYDGVGNIVTIGTPAAPGTQGYRTYGYDSLSRLTSAQIGGVTPGATYGYEYDVYGNRTSSTVNQQVMPTPQVDAATNRLTGTDYGYDVSGNQMINGSSVATWDGFAMMTSYRFGTTTSNTNTYVYTANDERIGVLRGSEWTWTLRGPDGKPQRQYLSSTSAGAAWIWVEDFVYRGGSLLASERAAAEGGLRHYHLDHLGSARLVTSATGTRLSEHDFLPFGGERTEIGQHTSLGFSREEPLRYTGHERDFENAEPNDSSAYIDYMHARYYGPNTGRFLSVDPTWDSADLGTPQSWNRYTYVRNNPINRTDPDGRVDGNGMGEPLEWICGGCTRAQQLEQSNHIAKGTAGLTAIAVSIILTRGDAILGPSTGEETVTRYMGEGEAETARRTGNIPNTDAQGNPRPTHVTPDKPLNSAEAVQKKYELPVQPTHRATVPQDRVPGGLVPTPDGRPKTSGGGSQGATNQPIPVKPDEIKPLDRSLLDRFRDFFR